MKVLVRLSTFYVLALLAGCSSSPTEADAKRIFELHLAEQSGGIIKLWSFQKTSGIERDLMGTKVYQIDYAAEVEFTKGCTWTGPASMNWDGRDFRTFPSDQVSDYDATLYHLERFNKGARKRFTSSLMLEESEKGWRLFFAPKDQRR